MTPEDIAETVYIRLSETDDRGEHIRIIAGAVKDAYERAEQRLRQMYADIQEHERPDDDGLLDGISMSIAAIRALGTEGE